MPPAAAPVPQVAAILSHTGWFLVFNDGPYTYSPHIPHEIVFLDSGSHGVGEVEREIPVLARGKNQ